MGSVLGPPRFFRGDAGLFFEILAGLRAGGLKLRVAPKPCWEKIGKEELERS